MGFFDSVLPSDKASTTNTSSQSAVAVAAPIAPAPAVATVEANADFLIIDDSVNVANVPDTVAPSENVSDILIMDTVAAPIVEEVKVENTPETAPTEENSSAPVLDFSAMSTLSVTPALDATEMLALPAVEAVEAPVSVASAEAPAFGFDILASASEAPVAEVVQAMPEAVPVIEAAPIVEAPVAHIDTLDPETILLSSIAQLEAVVSAKESARDSEMARTENLNAQIAELKRQAKESQEHAREIDASADRARALISNLKAQIPVAA